ncbi:hypothetical protein LAZ67_X001462 [Cordylochernes scorpioides]|uniref:Uncharacterized protein n=1 Tax=Cordylochernes scorpioides TaxID=51811 RepID=A0ABY6LUK4_9ARAC|nr:hypothetical protein LAZ67_X001462 [Cordylochernes scorpioides]
MDLLRRFSLTDEGNRSIIVFPDYLTKYVITKALPSGIQKTRQRSNKTLGYMLFMYVDAEHTEELGHLFSATLPLPTTRLNNGVLGFSLSFLVHGREAETLLDVLLPYEEETSDDDFGGQMTLASGVLKRSWSAFARRGCCLRQGTHGSRRHGHEACSWGGLYGLLPKPAPILRMEASGMSPVQANSAGASFRTIVHRASSWMSPLLLLYFHSWGCFPFKR